MVSQLPILIDLQLLFLKFVFKNLKCFICLGNKVLFNIIFFRKNYEREIRFTKHLFQKNLF